MRSQLQVNVRQSVRTIVEIVRYVQLSKIRTILFFVAIAITASFAAGALADGDSPANPFGDSVPKFGIVDFRVSFDGIDQYYVSGQIVGTEYPDGITIKFGDCLTGHSTTTEYGGYFGYLVCLSGAQHETFSAIAIAPDGGQSDRVSAWVW